VLFDHDAKVSGNSAPFADFLAAGDQQPWAVCVKDWGRLDYRSVTHLEARPRPDGTWARCWPRCRSPATAPCWPHIAGFRAIRIRQIAEDQMIGNVVAGAGLPALVPERHLDGKPECPAGTGLRDPQAWRPLPAAH
jgi:hypothetical protein